MPSQHAANKNATNKLVATTLVATTSEQTLDSPLPNTFPITVVLEKSPAKSEWIDYVWKAIAVTVANNSGGHAKKDTNSPRLINTHGAVTHYLCGGLSVTLFKDECESYYFNLISETPRCYVIAHVEDSEEAPDPFLISMSFDEAHAYLEGEDEIYAVDVPPELYRWTEAYVLHHYAPEKKVKRQRTDWKMHKEFTNN